MKNKLSIKSLGLVSALLVGSVPGLSFANEQNALTISPIHLLFPVYEVAFETPIAADMSITGILGYGSITVEGINEPDVKISIFEAGGQYRYYFSGNMARGAHIGVEAQYIKPSLDDKNLDVTVSVNGFAVGPIVGYKWNTSSNVVYDLQMGYQKLFSQAKAKDSFGNEIDSSVSDNVTVLNFNVGFAF